VQLKSERLRYKIDVSYPQIVGTEDLHIRKLNQHIQGLVTEQYQRPLNPSKADLRYYREKWPDVFNSVDLDYEIRLAIDSLLSIYFTSYSYGIGAAHSVQYSFVMNYDLSSRKQLKLSDLFKRHSKYLEFISRYCIGKLSKGPDYVLDSVFQESLPLSKNFESWNITPDEFVLALMHATSTAVRRANWKSRFRSLFWNRG
jgi:peptidoglycan-N-acetylmuramic acid deacetylase PdaC-like protein